MTWLVEIGDADPIDAFSGEALMVGVSIALVASGVAVDRAREHARGAWRTVCEPENPGWVYPLPDGREVRVRDALPLLRDVRCDGLDGNGDRCGRNMNHRGEC